MIKGRTLRRTVGALGAVLVGIVVPVLTSGCGEGYSSNMAYGLREDVLIASVQNAKPPTALDTPGQQAQLAQIIATQGGTVVDPNKLTPDQRKAIQAALAKGFGKPSNPLVANVDDTVIVDEAVTGTLEVDAKTLARGSALYRRHCLHCHGLTGNGQGPTAPWVNPHPRDYRRGMYKFVSTRAEVVGRKPSRKDLLRVVRQGVEGTSMPAFGAISGGSFGVLSDEELNALVSYVIHLSIRGQTEFDVINEINYAQTTGSEVQLQGEDNVIVTKYKEIIDQWVNAQAEDAQIVPVSVKASATEELKKLDALIKNPPKDKAVLVKELQGIFNAMPFSEAEIVELLQPLMADLRKTETNQKLLPDDVAAIRKDSHVASVERGFNMFVGSACAQCHLDFGRKDNLLWDDWGTIVRPANLTLGVFRGGRRPVDLYWRIHSGIPGANMPANEALTKVTIKGPDGKDVSVNQPWRLWDVVNFVEAAPYRKMLPPKVADAIHPQHLHE